MKLFVAIALFFVPSLAMAQYNGGYGPNTIPVVASEAGTTTAIAATLTATVNATTYICGLSIRANATSGQTGMATVTGVIDGTMSFVETITQGNGSPTSILEPLFNPCIPATGPNIPIVVNSIAPGAGGIVSVNAWGYMR
jgi:hypothetical protein